MEKPAEALAEIQAGMQIHEILVTQNPEVPAYREGLAAANDQLGILLMTTGKFAEARAAYGRARELLQQDGDGSTLYDAACFYAQLLVREKDTEKGECYAVRALELLRQAQSRGYFQNAAEPVNVNKDTDLDPIRNREDFRQWLR